MQVFGLRQRGRSRYRRRWRSRLLWVVEGAGIPPPESAPLGLFQHSSIPGGHCWSTGCRESGGAVDGSGGGGRVVDSVGARAW